MPWVSWVSDMGTQGFEDTDWVLECFEHLVCFLEYLLCFVRSDLDAMVVGFEDSDWVLPVVECSEYGSCSEHVVY